MAAVRPRWQTYRFDDLDVRSLYAILALRQEVFVVEQDCAYLDTDGRDEQALHLCGYGTGGELLTYARIFDRGIAYPEYASIGRVITAPGARGRGLGRPLMLKALEVLFEHYGRQPIKLSAQAHLQAFYGSVGFVGTGDVYDEDGIPHRAMVLLSLESDTDTEADPSGIEA